MKKYIILLICAFPYFTGRAQINLVLNPQFEQYSVCPDVWDETKYCTHWMSLDSAWSPPDWAHGPYGVPDYCNTCSGNSMTRIPNNMAFYRYPRSGNGMVQVQMYSYFATANKNVSRDYLQGHLLQTLIAGHRYNVTFYTTLEQGGSYAVNNIGAYLDDGTIDTTHNPGYVQNQYTPQAMDTSIINDTLNWVKIEDTFTATGTEKLITIGQFTDSAHTHYIALPITVGASYTWYLIDDVSVIDCDNLPNAGHDTTIMHVGDSVFIGSHEPLLPYIWYKSGSSTAIDSGGGIWVHPAVTTTYILEQKLCGVKRWDTIKVRVYPDTVVSHVGIEQLLSNNLKVYPNPAKTEFTIEGARNCYVTISDIAGRVIINAILTSDKEQMDIASLDRGIYLVQVMDMTTGVRVLRKVNKE